MRKIDWVVVGLRIIILILVCFVIMSGLSLICPGSTSKETVTIQDRYSFSTYKNYVIGTDGAVYLVQYPELYVLLRANQTFDVSVLIPAPWNYFFWGYPEDKTHIIVQIYSET